MWPVVRVACDKEGGKIVSPENSLSHQRFSASKTRRRAIDLSNTHPRLPELHLPAHPRSIQGEEGARKTETEKSEGAGAFNELAFFAATAAPPAGVRSGVRCSSSHLSLDRQAGTVISRQQTHVDAEFQRAAEINLIRTKGRHYYDEVVYGVLHCCCAVVSL